MSPPIYSPSLHHLLHIPVYASYADEMKAGMAAPGERVREKVGLKCSCKMDGWINVENAGRGKIASWIFHC